MKLYTEEQVKHAMIEARISPWLTTDFLLGDYTPIELPSEFEIDDKIEDSSYSFEFDAIFKFGVEWTINHIKQQVIS
jgi:hypothetical protein